MTSSEAQRQRNMKKPPVRRTVSAPRRPLASSPPLQILVSLWLSLPRRLLQKEVFQRGKKAQRSTQQRGRSTSAPLVSSESEGFVHHTAGRAKQSIYIKLEHLRDDLDSNPNSSKVRGGFLSDTLEGTVQNVFVLST